MINSITPLIRHWKWFFLICFSFQILLIIIFFNLIDGESNHFENLIPFDKRLHSEHHSIDPSDNAYHFDYLSFSGKSSEEVQSYLMRELVKESKRLDKHELDKDEFLLYNCDTNDSYLQSAIERAKTNQCRSLIRNTFCLHQNNQLYEEAMNRVQNRCPFNGVFKYLGCYLNNRRPSLIDSFVFHTGRTNELKCSYLCTQLNTKYFGLENATNCHCLRELPSRHLIINSSLCNTFCDTKTKAYRCGGEYLVSVYETGITNNNLTKYQIDYLDTNDQNSPIRIAFLFSLNGRAVRQIKRLIKQLYDPRHFYFIHVDKKNNYLYNALSNELKESRPNIVITNERYYTVWGSSQLLEMLLNSFKLLLSEQWDYVINLSESDYPIKSLSSLENYLTQFEGKNFLKFHGQTDEAFIRKQGLEVLFLHCENRMWRLNKHRKLLKEIGFTGGSDWFALHRSFVNYIVDEPDRSVYPAKNKDIFLSNLKKFFNHTLLPAESFFHTVLHNSVFCSKLINNNLRLTLWKRKIGCRCQYRHIVDWCGCSPNVFREQDWIKLKFTLKKPLFLARKFDPLIDHEIINQIESTYSPSSIGLINVHKYWHNEYDINYDKSSPLLRFAYTMLSSIALRKYFLNYSNYRMMSNHSLFESITLTSVHIFIDRGKYAATLIAFDLTDLDHQFKPMHLSFETRILSIQQFKSYHINSELRLVDLKVCTDYDVKEDLFRNFNCIMDSQSQLIVRHRWRQRTIKLYRNFTIHFVWIHETSTQITIENEIDLVDHLSIAGKIIKNSQIKSLHFESELPIRPGVWRLLVVSANLGNFKESANKMNHQSIYTADSSQDHSLNKKIENKILQTTNSKDNLDHVLNDIMQNDMNKVKSRVIGETKFLVLDQEAIGDRVDEARKRRAVEKMKLFWKIEQICLNDFKDRKLIDLLSKKNSSTIKNCMNTSWSGILSDPKSQF